MAQHAEELLSAVRKFETINVEIAEWNCTFTLRSLTRGEVRQIAERGFDSAEAEAFAISATSIVPALTQEQAAELLNAGSLPATECLLSALLEFSGLTAGFRAGATGGAGTGGE